jgi:hypothetical protein
MRGDTCAADMRRAYCADMRCTYPASVPADAFELGCCWPGECRHAEHQSGNVAARSDVHNVTPRWQV